MLRVRRAGLVIHPRRDARIVADEVERFLQGHGVEVVPAMPPRDDVDAVIVLGGDGLLMHTAADYAPFECPVLGINLGRLGFLTVAERASALPAVTALLEGRIRIEDRMMLEGKASRLAAGKSLIALNDLVFNSGTKMATYEVRVADQALVFRCDGIILATSTGSTAYNASVFGPIIDPDIDCLIVTIRAPQPLPFPSVVVHPSRTLEVAITHGSRVTIASDGRNDLPLAAGDQVTIQAATARARLIRLLDNDFYQTLNTKFNLPLRAGTAG